MEFPRASGVLLHVTSLPGEFGIGDLGPSAYRFVDFLEQAGQQIWQILPLGPTVQCDSPYSCYSAFAGNALLISPEELRREGLLTDGELAVGRRGEAAHVDYVHAHETKWRWLELARGRFFANPVCQLVDEFEAFCTTQRWWLDDFTLFAALMKHLGTDQWERWPHALVIRDPAAIAEWKAKLAKEIELEQFVQYVFYAQWRRLKLYANRRGVRLFGDMPIFVAHGSADVWANQSIFFLDEVGKKTVVAGVPPDYFSETGQLWGNPLYRWDVLKQSGYAWWVRRFQSAFELYDLLRIDHFRAFQAYWEVPADAPNAIGGRWVNGPGAEPFDAARRALGELAIVAEDLGLITDKVHELRERLHFPGMRVMQFGFDVEEDVFHRPDHFPENSVAYTGTHDNSTIIGWYHQRKKQATDNRDILERYLDHTTDASTLHWQLISMVFGSAAHTAIVPAQDILGLDDTARMNVPGLAIGNWGWRLLPQQLNDTVAAELRIVTEHTERLSLSASQV
jgi:4-alpha-glucanotransferase